ncbi:MAG: helix-turn-helix transcriptional regulator [Minisyncoccia bacterium]
MATYEEIAELILKSTKADIHITQMADDIRTVGKFYSPDRVKTMLEEAARDGYGEAVKRKPPNPELESLRTLAALWPMNPNGDRILPGRSYCRQHPPGTWTVEAIDFYNRRVKMVVGGLTQWIPANDVGAASDLPPEAPATQDLKELRETTGCTLDRAGMVIGSRIAYTQIEMGERTPRRDTIVSIAGLLDREVSAVEAALAETSRRCAAGVYF